MKRNRINVIFSLLLALCCIFVICDYSFMGVKVNAIESENAETTPTIPEGTYTYDDEEGVIEFTFIDEKTLHFKIALLDGTYKEGELNYEYNLEKKFYTIIAGDIDANVVFTLNHETHTIEDYYPEEDEPTIEDTAKEIGLEVEKLVLIIAGILSALGVSGTFIGSFAKWISNKLKKNNEDLKDSKEVLKEAAEMFKKSIQENEEAKAYMKQAEQIMTKAAEMIKTLYEDTKAKSEEIGEIASEILVDNTTEGGGEDVSI